LHVKNSQYSQNFDFLKAVLAEPNDQAEKPLFRTNQKTIISLQNPPPLREFGEKR
jgi:hypothetical protein